MRVLIVLALLLVSSVGYAEDEQLYNDQFEITHYTWSLGGTDVFVWDLKEKVGEFKKGIRLEPPRLKTLFGWFSEPRATIIKKGTKLYLMED